MHRQLWSRPLGAPSGAAALVLAAFAAGSAFAQEPTVVIRGATVFTGDDVLETATVTIRGRTIEAVAVGDVLPPAAGDDATVAGGRPSSSVTGPRETAVRVDARGPSAGGRRRPPPGRSLA